MSEGEGERFGTNKHAKITNEEPNVMNKNSLVSNEFYPGLVFKNCMLPSCCRGMIFMLILMCLAIIGQGMIVSGQLPITLSMLEKNFGYTSVQTGLIHSFYDAFFGVSGLIVGLFAKKRKVFVIGLGVFTIALGCALFTVPNFLFNFNFNNISSTTNTTPKYIDYGMCKVNDFSQLPVKKSGKIGYLAIFCLSYGLIGIGAAPMHTSGIVYFDEHLTPKMSGLYLGIYYLFGSIGPAIGFGLGKPFLSLPVTLTHNVNSVLTSDSEGWIGAWWLGYVLGAALMTIVGIFFVLFPARVPKYSLNESTNSNSIEFDTKNNNQSICNKLVNYLISFKFLFKNTPYILLISGMSIEGIVMNGLGTFLAKIFEVQFRVSSGTASILAGVLAVLGAGIGSIVGGVIIKKIGGSPKNIALLIVCGSALSSILFSGFFAGCNTRNIDQIILNEKFEITGEMKPCQADCNCLSSKYEPICHVETKKTYFSPCMAGCHQNLTENGRLVFTQCSCLNSLNSKAVKGGCTEPCKMLSLFMVVSFFALLLNFLVFVPEITLMLQLLNASTKNSGLGLQQIGARIGFIIGPIIYGHLLDKSCILWTKEPTNNVLSYCPEYNNKKMRYYLSITSIAIKLVATFLYIMAYIFIKKSENKKALDNNNTVDEIYKRSNQNKFHVHT